MTKRTDLSEMNCSIARALDVVGEWWSLLVVREVYFGRRNFTQMHRTLGVARNILSDRLATLVEHDILERRPDPSDGRRSEYHLTETGRDLLPALVALMQWGDRWADDGAGAPIMLTDRESGSVIDPELVDRNTGRAIDHQSVRVRPGPGFQPEQWPTLRSTRSKGGQG